MPDGTAEGAHNPAAEPQCRLWVEDSPFHRPHGRGCGVGRSLRGGMGRGVGVCRGVEVGVGVAVAIAVAVGLAGWEVASQSQSRLV